MTTIETSGLTKRYGDVTAVDGLELTVADGEVFGFLGPNGAGKSTTIDCLLGFQRPTEGTATVLGHDATDDPRAVRARTGLLPEGYELYGNLTGREHLRSAVDAHDADDAVEAVLDRVGLDPADADRAVGGYSTGMRQRLALGIALVGEPDLLILDEPSAGLDPSGIRRLREIVREERDRGATVFFSSHVLSQVEKVCDRVGIMADGDLVAVDDIEGLRAAADAATVLTATVETVPDPRDLERVEGVRAATVDGTTVRVECTGEDAKMRVLERLNERTRVRDFDTEEASLESLFEAYTGASAGDRDARPAGDDVDTEALAAGGDNR